MRGKIQLVAGFKPMSTAVHCTWSPNKLWSSNSIFNLWTSVFHVCRHCCTVSYSFSRILIGQLSGFSVIPILRALPIHNRILCKCGKQEQR
jgi:hypothetical protein